MTKIARYQLLDCGEGRRLEKIGNQIIDRPSPGVQLPKTNMQKWNQATLYYNSSRINAGHWQIINSNTTEPIISKFKNFLFEFRPGPSGQIGIFPEQSTNWKNLQKNIIQQPLNILNLFAYTGLSSVAAIKGGHHICHVDSSKSVMSWAKRNATLNNIDSNKIRWINDDVMTFCHREIKRKSRYNGFILDPPSFGRGQGKKTWKMQRDLPILLKLLNELSGGTPELIILSSHHTGWMPEKLKEFITESFRQINKRLISCHTMTEVTMSNKTIQSGICCSYIRSSDQVKHM